MSVRVLCLYVYGMRVYVFVCICVRGVRSVGYFHALVGKIHKSE